MNGRLADTISAVVDQRLPLNFPTGWNPLNVLAQRTRRERLLSLGDQGLRMMVVTHAFTNGTT